MQKKKLTTLGPILLLQGAVMIYTLSTLCSKMASGYDFLSWNYILWMCADVFVLGIYAILWQQVIKRMELSTAYMNKAIGLFWSLLWSFLIFRERITAKNIVGAVIIAVGILIINSTPRTQGGQAPDSNPGASGEEETV